MWAPPLLSVLIGASDSIFGDLPVLRFLAAAQPEACDMQGASQWHGIEGTGPRVLREQRVASERRFAEP